MYYEVYHCVWKFIYEIYGVVEEVKEVEIFVN